VSGLELRTLRQFNALGMSETPDIKTLPWDINQAPGPEAQRKAALMGRLSDFGTVLGVVGGTLGLILTLRALGVLKKGGKA
jgi:hypothetical protein